MLYRYFLIDDFGLRLPAKEFTAGNDDEARSLAHQLMNGKVIEVWQDARLVVMLGKASGSPSGGAKD